MSQTTDVSRKELGGLVRQISHNSTIEYLLKINPSCLNLNRSSLMVLRDKNSLSGSVYYSVLLLVNESSSQHYIAYVGNVIM